MRFPFCALSVFALSLFCSITHLCILEEIADHRTLTEAEVQPVHNQVRDALVEKFGVSLRS
ncbi:hypothetical protein [Cylindrospermum stagnale]|uniref:hypothetical protein n=1 Tax=Cylindrospermum stagnale TaxID=142864 RepID=UPI0003142FEE|nr:hypothetical protein [Cylindrospermum stagnale]